MDRLRNGARTAVDDIESLLFYILRLSDVSHLHLSTPASQRMAIDFFFLLEQKTNRSGRRAVRQKMWWQELQRNEGQSENVMVYGVKLCVESQTTTAGKNEGTQTWRVFTATYTQGLSCLGWVSTLVRSVNKTPPYFAAGFFVWQDGIRFKMRWAVWCSCHVFSLIVSIGFLCAQGYKR